VHDVSVDDASATRGVTGDLRVAPIEVLSSHLKPHFAGALRRAITGNSAG
jgi:hypothetical protein